MTATESRVADLLGKLDATQRLRDRARETSWYADSAQAREQDERLAAQYDADAVAIRAEIDALLSAEVEHG